MHRKQKLHSKKYPSKSYIDWLENSIVTTLHVTSSRSVSSIAMRNQRERDCERAQYLKREYFSRWIKPIDQTTSSTSLEDLQGR